MKGKAKQVMGRAAKNGPMAAEGVGPQAGRAARGVAKDTKRVANAQPDTRQRR